LIKAPEAFGNAPGLDSIAAAKLLDELQQLSGLSAWHRLFWRQLRPTFCTSRSHPISSQCLLSSQKADTGCFIGMSALGQKRTLAVQNGMSALPLKPPRKRTPANGHVCFNPKADMCGASL